MKAQYAFDQRGGLVLVATILLCAVRNAFPQPPPAEGDRSMRAWQEIVHAANETTVLFISFSGKYENGLEDKQTGTGFIISAEGHFLTCSHVLPPSDVYKSYEAKVVVGAKQGITYTIGRDDFIDRHEDADLVVFRLPRAPTTTPWHSIQAISKKGAAHMPVMGLGFPLDEDLTYANGEITSLRAKRAMYWLTSAPLNRGMSGGPIFDESGAVIAVTASGHPGAQLISEVIPISFAVPSLELIQSPALTKQSRAVQQSAEQVAKAAAKLDEAEDALPGKELSSDQKAKVEDLLQKATESEQTWVAAYKKFIQIKQTRPGRESMSERQQVVDDLKDSANKYHAAGNALAQVIKTTPGADQ
jgi:S1-C subfamily serine protease